MQTKGRILVVDDEPSVREVLSRFLKAKGFEVNAVSNGREALDHLKRDTPHLVLLDLKMPELDGLDVLKALREAEKRISVMMITANSDLEVARKTMELGACDYIVKPFDLEYLRTTVMAKLLMLTS